MQGGVQAEGTLLCPAEESMRRAAGRQQRVGSAPERREAEAAERPAPAPGERLFPDSPVFKRWGDGLSGAQQAEAQRLFQTFGYNAYLSQRLRLDRPIPDTRHPR